MRDKNRGKLRDWIEMMGVIDGGMMEEEASFEGEV